MPRKSALRRVLGEIFFRFWFLAVSCHLYMYVKEGGLDTDIIQSTFGCASSPCVIKTNLGGNAFRFLTAEKALSRGERYLVIVDGPCASACVGFVDIGRDRVCITENATFGVHKGFTNYLPFFPIVNAVAPEFVERTARRVDQPLSEEFLALVHKRGGLLENGDVLWFSAQDVKSFLPLCQDPTREIKGDKLRLASNRVPLPLRDPRHKTTAAK